MGMSSGVEPIRATGDHMVNRFAEMIDKQGYVNGKLASTYAHRVRSMSWQVLPQTTEVIQGYLQGAVDTYWVNPMGEILHVGHAREHTSRIEWDLAKRGPWLQIQKPSMAKVLADVDAVTQDEREGFAEQRRAHEKLLGEIAKLTGHSDCDH